MKNQVLLLIISKDHRQLLLIKFIKALKWSVINWIKKGWILCKKKKGGGVVDIMVLLLQILRIVLLQILDVFTE